MRVAQRQVTGEKRRASQGLVKQLSRPLAGDTEVVADSSKRSVRRSHHHDHAFTVIQAVGNADDEVQLRTRTHTSWIRES
jgi:hypothetical protein